MTNEMYDRLTRLSDEIHSILCDPETLRDDFVEHTMYAVNRMVAKMMNQLEAQK